jgi:hypothetical protein
MAQAQVDPSQIDQILAKLCVNARDAITGVGNVAIETHMATFDESYCANHPGFIPGEFVMLAVGDDGHGMDKEILDKIFELFFTTKEMGKGTGLGLPTVYGIVKQNKGFINAYSEPGHGTDVVMPGKNGRDLEKNIVSLCPEIRSLFMSGYTSNIVAHQGVLDEGVNFIQKPFSIQALAAKVREALETKQTTGGLT